MENWSSPENFGSAMDHFFQGKLVRGTIFFRENWSGGTIFSGNIGPEDHFFQGKLVWGDHFFQGILEVFKIF